MPNTVYYPKSAEFDICGSAFIRLSDLNIAELIQKVVGMVDAFACSGTSLKPADFTNSRIASIFIQQAVSVEVINSALSFSLKAIGIPKGIRKTAYRIFVTSADGFAEYEKDAVDDALRLVFSLLSPFEDAEPLDVLYLFSGDAYSVVTKIGRKKVRHTIYVDFDGSEDDAEVKFKVPPKQYCWVMGSVGSHLNFLMTPKEKPTDAARKVASNPAMEVPYGDKQSAASNSCEESCPHCSCNKL